MISMKDAEEHYPSDKNDWRKWLEISKSNSL